MPSLEAEPYAAAASSAGIDLVMIAAPNTPRPALERIARFSSGYSYCVARSGVTGTGLAPALDHGALFVQLRDAGAPPPILGFGISTPGQVVEALAAGAAGVITGSALVSLVAEGAGPAAVATFVRSMKEATRSAVAVT